MSKLKPMSHVVSRVIHGRALVLDHQRDEIQQLNEVGSFIWSKVLMKIYTKFEVLEMILQSFEITKQEAERDLNEFILHLQDRRLIESLLNVEESSNPPQEVTPQEIAHPSLTRPHLSSSPED